MNHRNVRTLCAAGIALLLMAGTTACAGAGSSESSEGGSGKFDDQFPAETFDGLSGSVAWLDISGGANTEALNSTIWSDFTALTGVQMKADFSESIKFLAAAEQGAPVPWSLLQLDAASFDEAKASGYLEKLDTSVVPVDELEDGSADEYGIEVLRSAAVLTYNTDKWATDGDHPNNMADLYDTEKYPGKRCFFQYFSSGAVLESALLADGVAPEDLYPLDVDRAFKKLDTIKDDIVWWSDGDESTRLLTTGECDLGIIWSGRAYSAAVSNDLPLAVSWDDAIILPNYLAIPKNAPNADAAQAAIAMWIRDHDGQVEYVQQIPYSTAIKGLEYPDDIAPWLPVGENAEGSILQDSAYYKDNSEALTEQFNTWVSSN